MDSTKQVPPERMTNGKLLKRSRDYCPVPGTVLIREYKGVEHRVTVTHDGQFEYQGCVYRSLSRIAREITGAQWSGPVFFGLRRPHRHRGGLQDRPPPP